MRGYVLLVISISCVFALVRGGCKTDSDCSTAQCCVDNSRWLIASKRDVLSAGPSLFGDVAPGGTCVDYIAESGNCHSPGFTSCGCTPGTKCVYYPNGAPNMGKRAMLFRPGTSRCEQV